MAPRYRARSAGDVAKADLLVARAVENVVARCFGQVVPRRVDVELVVLRERLDQLEIVLIAPIPPAHRAGRERKLRIDDDTRRIEELRDAEAVAAGTRADRRVEREEARLELRQRVIADRAREARRERRL